MRDRRHAFDQFQAIHLPFDLPIARGQGQCGHHRWLDTAYVRMQNVIVAGKAAGVAETYRYDGDGQRVSRTVGGSITTTYVFGVYEQEGAIARKYYVFNGKPVAMREGASTVSYLHGDHPSAGSGQALGSASAATNSSGVLISWQRFDPWGKIRASNGSMPTKQNFTGLILRYAQDKPGRHRVTVLQCSLLRSQHCAVHLGGYGGAGECQWWHGWHRSEAAHRQLQ